VPERTVDWNLQLDVDSVLRAEGAEPERVRARGSAAVAVVEEALAEAQPLLVPAVAQERHPAQSFRCRRLAVGGRGAGSLSGPLVARHLRGAHEVLAVVCTVGPALEARVAELVHDDPARAVALDAVGSAAVEQLATLAVTRLEAQAAASGLRTTLPLSPGLIGWPLERGQRELFALVDAAGIGVTLTAASMMMPRKSSSLVVGIGEHVLREGEVCDYCSVRDTCRYRPVAA
jgi:hypothetical protein